MPMLMEVQVFRTSVTSDEHVCTLQPLLDELVGKGSWNFALDDCDKILRIVADKSKAHNAASLLSVKGFECTELDD